MGIKLDWQVETEQTQLHAGEDPATRRKRRRARARFILLVIALAALVALAAALVLWRIDSVESQYRQDLIDTVEIEITALRLGDFANFMSVQRSLDDSFMLQQSQNFETYQELKRQRRVQLTGEIVDVTIDNLRGRVILEEVLDGVPYHIVWFYWYYEQGGERDQAGWRHVPDDLTFWGEEQQIETPLVRIDYRALDEALAEALQPRLEDWWTRGCALLGCPVSPPQLHVEIVARRPGTIEWAAHDSWTLTITSPLVDRARADVDLAPEIERSLATQVAARLVRFAAGDVAPLPASDAAWLTNDLARWLAGALLSDAATASIGPGFTESLAVNYTQGAVITALQTLGPNSVIDSVLTSVTGVSLPLLSLDQLNSLDWRGFFQWRLELEAQLLNQPEGSASFLSLYDRDTLSAATEATLRLESPAYAARPVPQVNSVTIARDDQSQTYAYVETGRIENGVAVNETVIWRLTGGTWKRVN